MPAIETLYITRWALTLIEHEARSYVAQGQVENETGGFLVGRRLDSRCFIVLAATGPGPRASHKPFVFAPDTDYGNRRLDEYHLACPDADYVGTWHKHPTRFPTFSQGDVETAWSIFDDPSYKLDELVCPIVWVADGSFYLNCYYIDRARALWRRPFQILPPARITILADHSSQLRAEAKRPELLLKLRLDEEREVLQRAGFSARLHGETDREGYLMDVAGRALGGRRVYYEIPLTYPLRPPTLIVELPDRQEPVVIPEERLVPDWEASPDTSILSLTRQLITRKRLEIPDLHQFPASSTGHAEEVPASSEQVAADQPSALPLLAALGLALLIVLGLAGLYLSDRAQTATSSRLAPTATVTADQRWTAVDAAVDPAARVRLIEALLVDNVTQDPSGARTVDRLFEARLLLAQSYAKQQQYDQAIAELTRAAASPPDDGASATVSAELAQIYLAAGAASKTAARYDQALGYYNSLLSLSPSASDADLTQARRGADEVKQLISLRAAVKAALDSYSSSAAARDWPAAIRSLDQVTAQIGLTPDPMVYSPSAFGKQTTALPRLLLEAHLAYATDLQRSGDLEGADRQYAQFLDGTDLGRALDDAQRRQAEEARARFENGRSLWEQVGQLIAARNPAAARIPLLQLQALDSFGPDARSPQPPGQTVSAMLAALPLPSPTIGRPSPPPVIEATLTLAATTALAETSVATAPAATPTLTSVADTPLPTLTPRPDIVYLVVISETTLEALTSAYGPPPSTGVNAFVDGPGSNGLTMSFREQGGAPILTFNSDDRWVLAPKGRPVVVQVTADGRGQATSQGGQATFVPGAYYRITVTRIS